MWELATTYAAPIMVPATEIEPAHGERHIVVLRISPLNKVKWTIKMCTLPPIKAREHVYRHKFVCSYVNMCKEAIRVFSP